VNARAEHPLDDLAAYALDALDGDEHVLVEAHLASCPPCRDELAHHQRILARLAGDEAPPTPVWAEVVQRTRDPDDQQDEIRPLDDARMLGDIRRLNGDTGSDRSPLHMVRPGHDPVSRAVAQPAPGTARGRHRLRRRAVAALAVAAAFAAAVGLAPLVGDGLGGDGGRPAPDAASPGAQTGVLTAADGTEVAHVVVGDDGRSAVTLDAVATLPSGRTYQLWSLDGPEPASLGLLGDGRDPTVAVTLPEGTRRLAISDEPSGGSTTPTGLIAGSGELTRPA
jgi:hypothetical protein